LAFAATFAAARARDASLPSVKQTFAPWRGNGEAHNNDNDNNDAHDKKTLSLT
jgi:hypothetical protein